ncbi:MAG: hypothetical protein ABIK89_18565, partial [Planctomycetota bacterium]
MKCPSCGADVAENTVICHTCGARLEAEIQTPSELAPVPEDVAASGAGRAARARAAQPEPVQEAVGQVAGSGQSSGAPGRKQECQPPWRYSLKDMRIIWLNMM